MNNLAYISGNDGLRPAGADGRIRTRPGAGMKGRDASGDAAVSGNSGNSGPDGAVPIGPWRP